MTITAARQRELKRECELDGIQWVCSQGSILVPESRAVVITIGIRLKSQKHGVSNNWRAAYGRSQQLRKRTAHALALLPVPEVTKHIRGRVQKIVFVRLASRLLDSDNLAGAFKAIRDQTVAWLAGQNHTSARADDSMRSGYEFSYFQQQQRLAGIRIELWP